MAQSVGQAWTRAWRKRHGVSLASLAKELGISESLLSRFERGLRALPDRVIDPLARITGIARHRLMTAAQRRLYRAWVTRAVGP